MARMPDWLGNTLNSDDGLVEDSPQFRQQYQKMQKDNLIKASNSALDAVRAKVRQSELDSVRSQIESIKAMTPKTAPLVGPDDPLFAPTSPEENTALTPNLPSQSDFDVDMTAPPVAPPDPAMNQMPPEMSAEENEVAEVEKIARETGMSPQQVAAMVLLGKDINGIESTTPPTTAPPPSALDMPMPLAGPTPQGVPPTGTLPAPPSPPMMA